MVMSNFETVMSSKLRRCSLKYLPRTLDLLLKILHIYVESTIVVVFIVMIIDLMVHTSCICLWFTFCHVPYLIKEKTFYIALQIFLQFRKLNCGYVLCAAIGSNDTNIPKNIDHFTMDSKISFSFADEVVHFFFLLVFMYIGSNELLALINI